MRRNNTGPDTWADNAGSAYPLRSRLPQMLEGITATCCHGFEVLRPKRGTDGHN